MRSLGPRLSPRNGIVYDLCLDPKMASRIVWANSRRLIFGNLLVLTNDQFHSCIFVTVEDRIKLEKEYTISVNSFRSNLINNKTILFLLITSGKSIRKIQYE